MNANAIQHVLYIRVKASEYEEKGQNLINLLNRMIDDFDNTRPYFPYVYILKHDDQDNSYKKMMVCYNAQGSINADALESIIDYIGKDNVKIGCPEVTLDKALEEVNIAIISENMEHEHQAEVVEQYSEAIDHRNCLHEYGYKTSASNIMKAQADINRQSVLEDIRDELKSIADCMRDINRQTHIKGGS